jgi:4-hydroxythreonine-4-phosphate dehydrogenase
MIALTMGEPAGIGAEIAGLAWAALRAEGPRFVFLGDAGQLGPMPVRRVATPAEAASVFAEALPVLHRPLASPPRPGHPNPANAPAVIGAIEDAVALARSGQVGAVVTNPIQKASLYAAGFPHPGHTEFLAELAGTGAAPVMLLCAEGIAPPLRAVPVTIHEALRHAIARLDAAMIIAAGRTLAAGLARDFGIAAPRIAVAGLNPHAGEGGAMGDEEARILAPAIAALREAGIAVSGPHPPDTMFTPAARLGYDAALCLYHDQALIPVKTLDMAGGVNVTLGLSIIRTSPDHGTALDIAGQGKADPASLIAAIRLAARLAANRSALR